MLHASIPTYNGTASSPIAIVAMQGRPRAVSPAPKLALLVGQSPSRPMPPDPSRHTLHTHGITWPCTSPPACPYLAVVTVHPAPFKHLCGHTPRRLSPPGTIPRRITTHAAPIALVSHRHSAASYLSPVRLRSPISPYLSISAISCFDVVQIVVHGSTLSSPLDLCYECCATRP